MVLFDFKLYLARFVLTKGLLLDTSLLFFVYKLCYEQIKLQAKLLNYFLGSNKSNINQSRDS